MSKIIKKFIADNAVGVDQIELENDQWLQSAAGNMLRWNVASSAVEFTQLPKVGSDTLATQAYADSISAGLDLKESVRVATTMDLGNASMFNGTMVYTGSGVGKTITAPAANFTNINTYGIDGVADLAVGQRVLVKDELSAVHNGIYVITSLGNGVDEQFVMTRASDADGTPSNEVSSGMFCFVTEGTDNDYTGWTVISFGGTVDTDTMDFSQFQGLPQYQWGLGLIQTGNQIDIDLASQPGLEFSDFSQSGQLQVKVKNLGGVVRDADGLSITLANHSTTDLSEGVNLYFTEARVLATDLLGFVSGAGVVSAADTVLSAFQKIDGNINAHLDGAASKHDASEVDYERLDANKKNILAASDDVESALTNLDDAIGALAGSPVSYSPSNAAIVADHLAAIDLALDAVSSVANNAATKALDNLASTAVKVDILPDLAQDTNLNLGDATHRWNDVVAVAMKANQSQYYETGPYVTPRGSIVGGTLLALQNTASPTPVTAQMRISADQVGGNLGLMTVAGGGSATGQIRLETGNTSGSAQSGNIVLRTGSGTTSRGSVSVFADRFTVSGSQSTDGIAIKSTGDIYRQDVNQALNIYTAANIPGNSGALTIKTGNADLGSGALSISTGTTGVGATSGAITISTASLSGGSAGNITISAAGTAADGDLFINVDVVEVDATVFNFLNPTKITNLANGTAANDAVNKSQLDAVAAAAVATIKETFTFIESGGWQVSLSQTPKTGSLSVMLKGAGALLEGGSYDYTISGTTVTFVNDLASGGASQLVDADVVQISYLY